MVVLSYSVIYYIYIPGTLGPCFHYWCSVYGICKWSDTLWPLGRVRLFADYTISLSSLCRLIWKHWTTKMLVRYMMPSVCLRLRQFSQLSLYSLYGAVCLQLTQFSCDDRENVYFILLSSSNRKYESLIINHCLGLGHETMVCAVCLTMFLKTTKNVFHYVKLTNLLFELDFQKVDQHTPRHQTPQGQSVAKPGTVEYPSRECKHDIKESKGNMLNQIFKENVQGQKHPGSCAFAEPDLLM